MAVANYFLITPILFAMAFCIHSYFKNNRLFQKTKSKISGKSNIQAFYYGQEFITSMNTSIHFAIPSNVALDIMESNLLLFYFQTESDVWYYADGTGAIGSSQSRFYMTASGINFYLYDINGEPYKGPKVTFNKFKLLIIPSHVLMGNGVGNIQNYNEVMRNLGLLLAFVVLFR